MSPVSRSGEQSRLVYDRLSRWYDLFGGFEKRPRDLALQMLSPGEGDRILEIGCGSGHAILALAKAVGPSDRVYGIDLARGMLNIARLRVKKVGLGERLWLIQGDARQLPFGAACFDRIFMSFTLELFQAADISRLLFECYRILRPKGRIGIVALSRRGGPSLAMRFYERLHEMMPQYIDCRPIYVQSSLEKAGFHTLEAREASLFGLRLEIVLSERA